MHGVGHKELHMFLQEFIPHEQWHQQPEPQPAQLHHAKPPRCTAIPSYDGFYFIVLYFFSVCGRSYEYTYSDALRRQKKVCNPLELELHVIVS